MMSFIKSLFKTEPAVDFKELIDKGAVVLDVRSASEFNSGHLQHSINIPVDTIGKQVDRIRNLKKPIITVCRSGSRSAAALSILKSAGIETYNGGSWQSVADKLNQN